MLESEKNLGMSLGGTPGDAALEKGPDHLTFM
jgi:hypothetical protein